MLQRHYELDWLRVLLFALLVPHHVAVGFVDWGADIYGFVNNDLAGDMMNLFIYWSHSWRLPSLFMIAGVGTWFLTGRGTGIRFMGGRLLRLLVPALFAAAFINVFGGYAIAYMTGAQHGFFPFWWQWLSDFEPRQVQHLWFLFNLAIYSVLCWPVFAYRDRIALGALLPARLMLFLLVVSVLAVVLFKPYAAAIAGDNYQFPYYLVFFLGGFLIGSNCAMILGWVGRRVWILLSTACVLFGAKVLLLAIALEADVATGEALAAGGWVPLGLNPENATLFSVIEAATAWAWCLTALGLAVRFLNKPSSLLSELNRAVFPVYVLHFPVTLVGLALVAQVSLPWAIEFFGLLIFVYGMTWILWRIADRLGSASYLVGGKPAVAGPKFP
ncbi:acyltransferase family protein [Loktanella sp. SALINAS62]|uniref:acyltransferase family protein n=1 Tax=Loktanella sp. SALINAS62 TaxID=2706124 RepID=UPI001B8C745C|nr:acyltransferase family protein [Loktanella sp. SALINAS62]MBS1301680.1 acyltransferase family protein [Loktanella sp. SALINAS62]